ncbi:MAG TPA: hypothetical protein VEQ59_07105 [Polyangiaceae bacterium]|nr:hypothetical protein [Polyangiaceae bacterium]
MRSNALAKAIKAAKAADPHAAVAALLIALRELQNDHDRTSRSLLTRIRRLEAQLHALGGSL